MKELINALMKAKRTFKPTGRSGANSFQKYKYATLENIIHAVESSLLDNGLCLIQYSTVDGKSRLGAEWVPVNDGAECLHTRIVHAETEQFIEDVRYLVSEKEGNQGKGAAQTYMRKYAIMALCGLVAEDDDGQSEQQHINKSESEYIDSRTVSSILIALDKTPDPDQHVYAICKQFGIDGLGIVQKSHLPWIKEYIKSVVKKDKE